MSLNLYLPRDTSEIKHTSRLSTLLVNPSLLHASFACHTYLVTRLCGRCSHLDTDTTLHASSSTSHRVCALPLRVWNGWGARYTLGMVVGLVCMGWCGMGLHGDGIVWCGVVYSFRCCNIVDSLSLLSISLG